MSTDELKAMIVEDSPEVVKELTGALKAVLDGAKIISVGSVDEALQFENGDAPDLYIVDEYLKGPKRGHNLIDAIRLRSPDRPVILISGDSEVIRWARVYGCKLLTKPFTLKEFRAAILAALNGE